MLGEVLSCIPTLIAMIKPIIESAHLKKNSKETLKYLEQYLKDTSRQYSKIKTIALGNQSVNLDQIYIPLTLEKFSGNQISFQRYIINKMPKEFIGKNILILDYAGMGKTTVMKWMFIDCIKSKLGYPIFINLRRIRNKNILDIIKQELKMINTEFSEIILLTLIKKGKFIFFLDGYDEIAFKFKSKVIEELKIFITKSNKNTFILSSRNDISLPSLTSFTPYRIVPLKLPEAKQLIEKYDITNNKIIAKNLNNEIENQDDNKKLLEFLKNPLLTSLLFLTFQHINVLISDINIFYRNVFDALYYRHDACKDNFQHEKKTEIGQTDFEKALRYLAFETLIINENEYNKDNIIKILTNVSKSLKYLRIRPEDFLSDLITPVPLLIEEGVYYKWCHKSMQEYFFAKYLWLDSNNKKEEYLSSIIESNNFDNYYDMLEIYYNLDYENFQRYIVGYIISRYVLYYEKINKVYSNIDLDDNIISILFLYKIRLLYVNGTKADLSKLIKKSKITLDIHGGEKPNVLIFRSKKGYKGKGMLILEQHNNYFNLLKFIQSKQNIKIYRENSCKEQYKGIDFPIIKKLEEYILLKNNETIINDQIFDILKMNFYRRHTAIMELSYKKCKRYLSEIMLEMERGQTKTVQF